MASKQQSSSQISHGASIANPESPYYIHPNETPVKVSLVLCGSSNYSKWYRAMNAALASRNKLGFVDGTIDAPATDQDEAWNRCNELIRSSFIEAVSSETADSIKEMDKAAAVWSQLKQWYSPGDPIIISDLLKEIHSLRQEEGQQVSEYHKKFRLLSKELEVLRPPPVCTCEKKCLCGALASVTKRMEQDKVASFLKGLNDQFAEAKSRIMRQVPLPSIEDVYDSVLLQEETPSSSSASNQAIPETQPGEEKVIGVKKLDLRCHKHPLTLKPAGAPYECSGCRELGFGPSYRCASSECSYVLHEDCANAFKNSSATVSHPFFKESNFSFLEKPPSYPRHCDACRKEVQGFVYHRPDSTGHLYDTGLDLHPCCLKLKDIIFCEEGNETRTLELNRKITKKCLKCKNMKVGDESKVKSWSYESSDGKYCYHVSCFKELIIEKWEEGYFPKANILKQTYDPETHLALTSKEIGEVGGSSKGSGTIKVVGKIASVVFQLIFTAIFGDPVSFVLTLVQALASIIG